MLYKELLYEIFWIFILAAYTFSVVFLTKKIYDYMIKKKMKKSVAGYYNRKFMHILAGGVVVLVVPLVFTEPWLPLLAGMIIGFIALIAHRSGNKFYWFQSEDNLNDVTFCFMWGIAIFVLWEIFGSPWVAVIPPAFIAFGDGITGIVRNLAFHERRKHPIGNIYMMGVCIPIGYYFASFEGIALWGVFAAIVASFFERYEFGRIDDNVLVTVSATVILLVAKFVH